MGPAVSPAKLVEGAETMAEPRYISQEQRATWLIEKGVLAWQEIQRLAMEEDELLDSVLLLGQELWLPHHETRGAEYCVTLRIAVHFPEAHPESSAQRFTGFLRNLGEKMSDDKGRLTVDIEER
jgi:hypothetical protein